MTETWKVINGFPNYEVSTAGNVRRIGGCILKPRMDKDGYYRINLYVKGDRKPKTYKIHTLVARAFLPNKDNQPMINHKDNSRINNAVENLEWCDAKYNNNYGESRKRHSQSMIGKNVGKIRTQVFKDTVSATMKRLWDIERWRWKNAQNNTGYGAEKTNVS